MPTFSALLPLVLVIVLMTVMVLAAVTAWSWPSAFPVSSLWNRLWLSKHCPLMASDEDKSGFPSWPSMRRRHPLGLHQDCAIRIFFFS